MDSSRLGRVLGVGARNAAKTLVGAVDAATAPNPRASDIAGAATPPRSNAGAASVGKVVPPAQTPRPASPRSAPERPVSSRTPAAVDTRRGVVEGGRRFGRAVWEPTARLGGVLWLEVTGLFFGIFVLAAAGAAWRLRGGLHAGAQHSQFLLAIGMTLLFGYFTVSSFISASRRSRRR